jgi:hypothetical protein
MIRVKYDRVSASVDETGWQGGSFCARIAPDIGGRTASALRWPCARVRVAFLWSAGQAVCFLKRMQTQRQRQRWWQNPSRVAVGQSEGAQRQSRTA